MQTVHFKSRIKQAFIYDGQSLENRHACFYGVEKSSWHLRSLGLVYNDINPCNVLFDEDIDEDTSIIIDFDSRRPSGEGLEGIGRTFEWYNESVPLFLSSND